MKISKNTKRPENKFFDSKGQKWSLQNRKNKQISKSLTENFDFWCHLSTFGAENSTKSRSFKVENTVRILSKQLQNNFLKVQ